MSPSNQDPHRPTLPKWPSGDDASPGAENTGLRELLDRMHHAFAAARAELELGESLFQALTGTGPEPARAPSADASAFRQPELRALSRRVRELQARCLEGIDDPVLRGVTERMASQAAASIQWTALNMIRFSELIRSETAGWTEDRPTGSSPGRYDKNPNEKGE